MIHNAYARARKILRRIRSKNAAESPAVREANAARRRAEEARDHWMGVFTALPLVVCVCRGREHIFEAVTGQTEKTFGRQLIGRTHRSVFTELAGQGWFENLDRVFETGQPLHVEAMRCVMCNGDHVSAEYFFDVRYHPRRDAHGETYGVILIVVDVTTQVHASRHLEDARRDADAARMETEAERERLSRVLAQAPFGVAVVSGSEHRVRVVNASQQRRIGRKTALGATMREAFPEPEMEELHRSLDHVFRTGETIVLREQPLGWDRSESGVVERGYFDTVYQAIRTTAGEIEAVLLFTVDVSASLRARQAVAAAYDEAERARTEAETAREYLRNVLAAVPAAICLVSGPEFTFEFVNPAYAKLVGGRPLVGRSVIDVFPEIAPEAFLARIRRVFGSGQIDHEPEIRAVFDRELTGTLSEGFFNTVLGPLRKPDGTIGGVVAATLEVTQQVRQRERISALHQEAEAARWELERAQTELETRIAERTAELAETNRALAAEIAERERTENNRRDLLRRLATAREDEQRRIARDLHDQVGQTLTALTLAVRAARSDPLCEAAAERLADVQRLADELAQDVHNLAVRLRPIVLDDLGLQAALAQLLSEFTLRTHVETDFQAAGFFERLPTEVETVLYRVVQEALTNVARHARASHVTVIVESHAGHAIAVVEDDGVGCEPESVEAEKRLGLIGMRERVSLVGGSLELEAALGKGTTVIARVPIADLAAR